MAFLQLIGVAAQLQVHALKEEVIAILTHIVMETLHAGIITAEAIIHHRVVTGPVLPTAVKVYIILKVLMHYSDKTNVTDTK